MKHIKYTKFFGWLAAAALLLTTSCKDDMLFGSGNTSEEVEVTFTLTPEGIGLATRADEGDDTDKEGHVTYPGEYEYGSISDGSKADMLIYAVYDEDGNLIHNEQNINPSDKGFTPGLGQTVMSIKTFPVTVKLSLKRGSKYTVAFWAQSSNCKAYKTSDLKKVEVLYGEIEDVNDEPTTKAEGQDDTDFKTTTPNNDELRDAFCRSFSFTAGEDGMEHNVMLYRPLAQINIGTSGFDFETITRNSTKKFLYSKIRLNRVARYLDVVEDKTYSSTTTDNPFSGEKTPESFAVADFGYAPIPAYTNWSILQGYHKPLFEKSQDENGIFLDYYPKYPSYTVWDWEYAGTNEEKDDDGNITNITYNYDNPEFEKHFPHIDEKITRNYYKGEEFLKVRLYEHTSEMDDEGKYNTSDIDGDGYFDYSNLNNHNEELSETFKYLSMCYVLTSSTKEEAITINNIKMWMATDENGADETLVFDIDNVPAQRNWRTNIVGNILTESNNFQIILDRDFAGEYNAWNADKDNWSGPLAKGVYYDAAADEIQISDADGLIWFQRMVNGQLIVRDALSKDDIGKPYMYYTGKLDDNGDEETATLANKYIEKPTDQTLLERILKATHQDHNDNSKGEWPKNGNFHFCGKNGPAHVKLMADIDLDDYDWIPIGWDVRVHDTSIGDGKYWDFNEKDGTQRAFCGTFDGNGHTISNLHNKTFTAKVHDKARQNDNAAGKNGPYDNVQWMPSGFFGMVSGWRNGGDWQTYATANDDSNTEDPNTKVDTKISNLRLFNVQIYGYHTGAGIAAIVNSKADKVNITDCFVDGGTLTLSPMYRGDQNVDSKKDRTFARGIYLGGIVGQYVSKNGTITGCEVRNVTIRGYRQIGGIVGSVSNYEQYLKDKNNWPDDFKSSNLPTIEKNKINNILIIADKFQPYDKIFNEYSNNVWKNGFGWKEDQKSLANPFVGGTASEEYTNNSAGNVQFAEFSTGATTTSTKRIATVGAVPLKEIPMLSSWFCDDITLTGNYYGETAVYIERNYHEFKNPWNNTNPGIKSVTTPFNLPYDLHIDYKKNDKKAAMYVESVTLDGKGAIGGRSVITPTDLNKENCAVMYVTSRDWKQFYDKLTGSKPTSYKKPTTINNVVLRGTPYAYTGMLLGPNQNMESVTLNKVAIYDVYQTLASYQEDGFDLDNTTATLTVNKSNLRGYTVPGSAWKQITYDGTTFEEGTYTSHGKDERTYKAEANTEFKNCYFKAPYIIDLSAITNETVTFTNCEASSTSTINKTIDENYKMKYEGVKYIVIGSEKGEPTITYCKGIKSDGTINQGDILGTE